MLRFLKPPQCTYSSLKTRISHCTYATMSFPQDIEDFLRDYPGAGNSTSKSLNLRFYRNEARCRPDNLFIDDLHAQWKGDYDTLEYNHGYIQWLFPIQEYGMNFESQPLQKHERAAMAADEAILERVMESYRIMLDFYGMRLADEQTGLLERSDDYRPRYKNLIRSPHNNLRISRILKHLSEMGLGHLNAGLILHILNEQSEHRIFRTSILVRSMDCWWANCLRDEEERKGIADLIERVREDDGFVFTREMYQAALQSRKDGKGLFANETGSDEDAIGSEHIDE